MIRITVHVDEVSLTIQFEGRLTGDLVQEAVTCWQQMVAAARKPRVRIDLAGVTVIDAAGKAFLAAARAQGAELVASGCLMRAIVQELAEGPLPSRGCPQNFNQQIT
jgi:anti-anti-sigma regulatory factor